jgi:hypothetical protein
MNEQKLNELAERAWAYQITVYEDNGVRTYGEQEKVFSKQKFAQLIVRECLRELQYTVLDTQELRRDRSKDYQVGWEDGMFDAGEMIKQHFGVEE